MTFRKNAYFLCIVLFCAHSSAWAENIKNIRIASKKIYTRVVFDLDKAPTIYKIKYMTSPERIVIEFTEGSINKSVIKNTSAYPLINNINGTNIRDGGFSIEIELQQAANFKHFILPPAKKAGYRLVIDITPGTHTKTTIQESSKPLTIIPETSATLANQSSLRVSDSVTDYKSDAVNLYDNKVLTDEKIEQLFQSIQGNTQLKESYYFDFLNRAKEKQKRIVNRSSVIKEHSNAPRFDIRGYQIKGNTLLNVNKLRNIIKPYTGKNKTFSDVQHALEALERGFQQAGYGMVQVYLPEQELTKGIIVFKVIEPKIKSLKVQGAEYFNLKNVEKSIVSLKVGQTPNTELISENLLLINENPAKKTTIQFLPSEEEGVLNTLINVKDKAPTKYSFLFDNTGTESTGYYRLGVAYQHANLTNNDDILNLQYTTSEKTSTLSVFGLSYHYPFYSLNSSLDVFGGYSTVNSGLVANSFTVSGKGLVLGSRFNQILSKQGNYSQRLSYGLDYRIYNTDAIPLAGGGSIIPDITVHPLSLTYSGQWSEPTSATGFNIQLHYNALTSAKDSSQFSASRTGAIPNYMIIRYGIEHAQAFAKFWQMRLALTGQQTSHALISGEQFGIGGATSVRGYNERDISNDKGFQATAEIYTPNYADSLWMKGADARFLLFYDMAQVSRNLPLPGEITSSKLNSVGVGFRLNYHDSLSLKLDIASPLVSSLTQNKGSTKLHASLNYIF